MATGVPPHDHREIYDRQVQAEWDAGWALTVQQYGDDACAELMQRTDARRRADAMSAIFRRATTAPASGASDTLLAQGRCVTGDGHLIDGVAVLRASLEQYVRFVVLDDDGVPIHWGRERRLFEGAARDAVMSLACRCTAPGCRVPSARSDADHLRPWSAGGPTNPDNGGPRCSRHNRLRDLGYASRGSQHGWHTYRRDGTEICRRAPPVRRW